MPTQHEPRTIPTVLVYERGLKTAEKLIIKSPLPLLCIGNRYLVDHQLEWLTDVGFRKVRLSLSDRPREVEEHVGNGNRWGLNLTTSNDPDFLSAEALLQKNVPSDWEAVFIVDGDSLIRFEVPELGEQSACFFSRDKQLPVMYLTREDFQTVIEQADVEDVAHFCEAALEILPQMERHDVFARFFRITEVEDFYQLHQTVDNIPGMFNFKGGAREEGVRLGRRTKVSAKATITGPALIGDGAFIQADAKIGPSAYIGDHAFIQEGAVIKNSVIAPGTYIGKNTFLENKYVCRNYLLDLKDHTSLLLEDPLIIADMGRPVEWGKGFSRGLAILLAWLSLPLVLVLLLVHRLTKGCWWKSEQILRNPVKMNLKGEYDYEWVGWHHFDFGWFPIDLLPSLWDVGSGNLHFVGNPPLRKEDLEALDEEWHEDLFRAKVGITGLVQQMGSEIVDRDTMLATCLYYNATRSQSGDFFMFMKALLPGRHRVRFLEKEKELI
jgi:NDP-sugar pyrophosphorylase family protein